MKRHVQILLFLVTALISNAAAPHLRFTHITTEGGLPSNCVRGICQDSRGFMWFATDGGLVRLDGRKVRVFNSSNTSAASSGYGSDNTGFKDDYVMAVVECDGNLWVGEESGLYRFDREHEYAVHETFKFTEGFSRPFSSEVRALAYDHYGNVWITSTSGIYRLDPKADAIDQIRLRGWNGHVAGVYVDSHNNIWALALNRSNGLYLLDKNTDTFSAVVLKDESGRKYDGGTLSMYEDPDGNLWIGNTEYGLLQIDPLSHRVVNSSLSAKTSAIKAIHSITHFAPGILMLGSNSGIHLANTRTGELMQYRHDELDPHSLSNVFVYPVVHDYEGGIWIGTYYGGVNYLAPDLKPFESFTHSEYRNSVAGNVVSRFCELPGGDVAIATEDGGLSRLTPATATFSEMNIFPSGHLRNIHALAADSDGNLWVGSYGNGITRCSLASGSCSQYKEIPLPGKTVSSSCYSLFIASDGAVYAGTMEGIARYDKRDDRFIGVADLHSLVMDIAQTPDGILWFATQGKGIVSYDPVTGKQVSYTVESKGVPHNHVNDLFVTPKGVLYAATSGGLVHWDRNNRKFVTHKAGTSSDVIFSVIEDQGNIWVTTPLELARISTDGQIRIYDVSEGIGGTPFSPGALFRSGDGKIYVGTSSGFDSFYPHMIKDNRKVPMMAFTGISVNNRDIQVGAVNQAIELPVSLNDIKVLEIPSSRNAITISFAALSFANPWMNTYRYKLEGFDKEWNEAGMSNSATYTNLPPGTYTLRVKGSNNDGVWNEEGISLTIKVLPPWYATVWMRILYFVLLLSIAYSIWKAWHGRTIKQQQEDLERLRHDKEKEVYDAKMSFFTMVAHEIRTPLSLIIGPLENLRSKTMDMSADVKRDLDIMSRNTTRLLELINELLDFKKVEREGLVGEMAPTDMPQLLRQVSERFRPTLDKSHIEFSEMLPPDGYFSAVVDPEALTKLVSNLLNNARKYTKSRISLGLALDKEKKAFTIKVGDDGPGIPEAERGNVLLPFVRLDSDKHPEVGGTGIGLSIVSKVSEAHGGVIGIGESEWGGAEFSVTIPVGDIDSLSRVESRNGIQASIDPIGSKPRVLVVDDNPDMVSFLAYSFAEKYDVLTASDGREALRLLSENEVSVIVSDWMMSGMDGLELCRSVRGDQALSHIPFVMLTAKTDDASKVEGTNEGADVYVEKPFSVDYMKAVVDNLLEIRRRLQEKYAGTPLVPMETVATTRHDSEFLQKLDALIRDNLTNPQLSVDFLAESSNMSRSSFYSKIKEMTDVTPNELIQITRLKKAAELLKAGDYRISEICYMVGFNSPSYFSKCFVKQFGIKPSDFA